jgi:hypothetical protein
VCAELVRTDAEDAVADRELGDRWANCFDLSGQLAAEDPPVRSEEAGDEAADEILGAAKPAVRPVDRRGVDLHEDLVVLRHRPLDLFESQNVRRPVPVVDNRSHGFTPHLRRRCGLAMNHSRS